MRTLAGTVRDRPRRQPPLAQRPALVRAAVADREELVLDAEDADRARPGLDDPALAGREVLQRARRPPSRHGPPVEGGGVAAQDRLDVVRAEVASSAPPESPWSCGASLAYSSSSRPDHLDRLRDLRPTMLGSCAGAVVKRTWLADVLRRALLDPRHLAPDALPVLVEPPQQRGQPREPALGEHHPQLREAREHALGDEADQLRLGDVGVGGVVLQVRRREPGRASAPCPRGPTRAARSAGRGRSAAS